MIIIYTHVPCNKKKWSTVECKQDSKRGGRCTYQKRTVGQSMKRFRVVDCSIEPSMIAAQLYESKQRNKEIHDGAELPRYIWIENICLINTE